MCREYLVCAFLVQQSLHKQDSMYFRRVFSKFQGLTAWIVTFKTRIRRQGIYHRNQTISRKGTYIISRRPSHGQFARRCCPQAFLRIFSEVTYIRAVGNSSLLKIYTLPNHTITIGVYILETQLHGLLYGGGRNGPCRGYLILYRSLFYIVWFLWHLHRRPAIVEVDK
jgi:hypothetical protein